MPVSELVLRAWFSAILVSETPELPRLGATIPASEFSASIVIEGSKVEEGVSAFVGLSSWCAFSVLVLSRGSVGGGSASTVCEAKPWKNAQKGATRRCAL